MPYILEFIRDFIFNFENILQACFWEYWPCMSTTAKEILKY